MLPKHTTKTFSFRLQFSSLFNEPYLQFSENGLLSVFIFFENDNLLSVSFSQKTSMKNIEEESQRQAQITTIQFPAIRMPIRLDIIDSGSPDTSSTAVGLGIAQKGIQASTNERKKTTKQ